MLLVGHFPTHEATENPSGDAAVTAAWRIPQIDDQRACLAKVVQRAVEGFDGAVASERVMESDPADSRTRLGVAYGSRRGGAELIAGRELHGPSRVPFAQLEPPARVVTSGEHRAESPVARGGDRVRIRATHPRLHGLGNRRAVDREDHARWPDAGPLRIGSRAHLGDQRQAAAPLGPQVAARGHEAGGGRRVDRQLSVRVVQLVDHSLQETDELVPGRDPPQFAGIKSGDVVPGGRLLIEIPISRRDLLPGKIEFLLEVDSRQALVRSPKTRRDEDSAGENRRENVPHTQSFYDAGRGERRPSPTESTMGIDH